MAHSEYCICIYHMCIIIINSTLATVMMHHATGKHHAVSSSFPVICSSVCFFYYSNVPQSCHICHVPVCIEYFIVIINESDHFSTIYIIDRFVDMIACCNINILLDQSQYAFLKTRCCCYHHWSITIIIRRNHIRPSSY